MPKPPDQSDDTLMLAVQRGDLGALDHLFVRHHRPLYGYMARMTGDRHAAEDLVQEAFLRLLRLRGRYAPQGRFRAWLFRIGHNLAHDHIRAGHRLVAIDDAGELGEEMTSALEDLEEAEQRRSLEAAVTALPPQHRDVLLLRGVEGLSNEEIASVLGCSHGAVRVRIHRAVSALRARLAEMAEEP